MYQKYIYLFIWSPHLLQAKGKKKKKSGNRWKDSEGMWQALQKIKMGSIKSPNKIKIAM